MIRLKDIVLSLEALPTLPPSLYEVTRILDDPESRNTDLARAVKRDHVITSRVLKLINSSFYAFPRRISDIDQSIALLGRTTLKNLMFATTIVTTLSGTKSVAGLWVHALATGVAARNIGKEIRFKDSEELFTCGLLHDVGKVAQFYLYPGETERLIAQCVKQRKFYCDVEKERFEIGHDTVVRMLFEKWKLPKKICDVVGNHHHPLGAETHTKETAIVYVANHIARFSGTGESLDGNLVTAYSEEILDKAGLADFRRSEWAGIVAEQTADLWGIL